MYTEERKGNLLKQFLIKLILIIIFVLLLIWLVPWPNMDSYIDAINPLKDQIFNENVQTMKDAAITYYTTERLPQNVGDVKKLTLKEMLDMKLLLPFTDRNGNACDVKASYVSLEKKDTEYLMKVNLKCGEEENYILVHLGCYSYCSTAICEQKQGKKENDKPVTYICKYVDGKYYDANGKVTTKSGFDKSCTKPTVTPKTNPKCQIVNGTFYDNKGNVVSEAQYKAACFAPVVYKCAYVDGKYFDNNGKVVSEATYKAACIKQNPKCAYVSGIYYDINGNATSQINYEEQCLPHVCTQFNNKYYDDAGKVVDITTFTKKCLASVCKVVNGVYFDINGKATNEITYQEQCFKHICTKFNGKYYDNNGKVTTEAGYKNACEKKTYQYEYKKTTPAVPGYCGAWSNYKVKVLSSGSVPTGINERYKVEDLGTKKVQIGVIPGVPAQYEYKTVINETLVQTGTQTFTVCDNIGYEVVGGQLYQVNGGWSNTGVTKTSYGSPAGDSADTRWRAVGLDYDTCGAQCANNPSITWQQQKRSVSAVTTTVTLSPVCTSIGTKVVPVYTRQYSATTEKLLVKAAIPETPLYGNKHLYKESTCTNYINPVPESTIYKWSNSSNDQTLINQGYVYTGKVVEK